MVVEQTNAPKPTTTTQETGKAPQRTIAFWNDVYLWHVMNVPSLALSLSHPPTLSPSLSISLFFYT